VGGPIYSCNLAVVAVTVGEQEAVITEAGDRAEKRDEDSLDETRHLGGQHEDVSHKQRRI